MIDILGYIAAILIGISLGMVGSGGSILTVPVLVYLLYVDPLLATTSSLFIVGTTSLVGGIRSYLKGLVDFRAVTEFGFPSILSIFVTRHYILPTIPEIVYRSHNVIITSGTLLMIIFAVLMLAASISMIFNYREQPDQPVPGRKHRPLPLILFGLMIGLVTGLLGAGGGFLIIPTLVVFLRLPMKRAVGTSLLIVAINSLFGFLFSLKQFEYDWKLILSFTGLAIVGLYIGSRLAEKIPARSLKRGFGFFILLMAVLIIVQEVF
jgi:uncharacterized protein